MTRRKKEDQPEPVEDLYEVIVYHDETLDAGSGNLKGHVLYLVPVRLSQERYTPLFGSESFEYRPEDLLFEHIKRIRSTHGFDRRFHFCKISGAKWTKWDVPFLQASNLAVDSLRSKRSQQFKYPLCCKLAVLFYPKKSDISLYGGDHGKEKYQRHDETLLRMLLKGAAHYLYGDGVKVLVSRIVSDGEPKHRPLDSSRIVWQLFSEEGGKKTQLRDYVSFTDEAVIDHVSSNHREHELEGEHYRHAQHLQLADMLLGGVIHACHKGCQIRVPPPLGTPVSYKRDIISTPIKSMLEKRHRGRGFRHSGHYKSFTISEVGFATGEVVFKEVSTKYMDPILHNLQEELDFERESDEPVT